MMAGVRLERITFEDVRGARTVLPKMGGARLRRSVLRIPGRNDLCSIATLANGRPYINTAYFSCSAELVLYFLSHPNAQHCRNLATNRNAAATVFGSSQPWGTRSVGVQLFGTCRPARGPQQREAERLYGAHFRAYRRWHSKLAKGEAGGEYRFYRLMVDALALLDEKTIADGVIVRAVVRRTTRRSVKRRRATEWS